MPNNEQNQSEQPKENPASEPVEPTLEPQYYRDAQEVDRTKLLNE